MPNPKRPMSYMVKIDAISPIDGADRIVAARVGGWTVVVGKDDFKAGDLAVFFEIDTFLPEDDPRYEGFVKHGVKEMIVNNVPVRGHVLRTAHLRGVYSQGLLMRPQDVLPNNIPEYCYEKLYERKVNLTSLCGVREYDPILPVNSNMTFLREYDLAVAPRTDAERIENVNEDVFELIKKTDYFVSVKVDGTSITAVNDPREQGVRVFGHNYEIATDSGFGKQVYEQAEEQGIVKWLEEHPGITLQMEVCGPKINGNRLGLKSMRLYIFSMWDTVECKYLNPYDVLPAYCVKVGSSDLVQSVAPMMPLRFLLSDYPTTLDLIDYVDGLRGHVTDRLDEGIVVHIFGKGKCTNEEMRKIEGVLGEQFQMKVLSRKYLLRAKE